MPAQTDGLDHTMVQLDLDAFGKACDAKGVMVSRGRRDLLGGDQEAGDALNKGARIAKWRVESAAVRLDVTVDHLIRGAERRCQDCGADMTGRRPNALRCETCAAEAKKRQNRESSSRNYRKSVESRKQLARAAGVRDRAGKKPQTAGAPIAQPAELPQFPVDKAAIVDASNVTLLPVPRGMAIVHLELEALLHTLGLNPNVKVRDLWAERLPVLGAAPKLVVVLEGPGLPAVPEGAEIPHMDAVVRTRPPYEMEIRS